MRLGLLLLLPLLPSLCGAQMRDSLPNAPVQHRNRIVKGAHKMISTDGATAQIAGPPKEGATSEEASASSPGLWSHALHNFWLGGQVNVITQGYGHFYAKYSGPQSFENYPNVNATSMEDFYSGAQITRDFEILFDVEDIRGNGLSNTFGIAGFPDLDAQRAPTPGTSSAHTYMSRFLLHGVVPLGVGMVKHSPNYLNLASSLPARRFQIYFGKFSLADFFDRNAYANDDHNGFMNWTADQNGAWDMAGSVTNFTYGGLVEFDDRNWKFRYAEVLESRNPNGRYLDLRIGNNKSGNAQVSWGYSPSTHGKVRLLGYVNEAGMGSFADALAAWHKGLTPTPSTLSDREIGAHEYGYGLNWQQGLPRGFGLFSRIGWNNGKYENYSFTEVNNTVTGGVQIPGALWKRRSDHAGVAYISNGISTEHQKYLAAGGIGFMLGDGGLTYGREQILEAYYNLKLPVVSFAPDFQFVRNPGYNQVRGPVAIFGLRMHIHLGFHRAQF